jgi:hypothetical protein
MCNIHRLLVLMLAVFMLSGCTKYVNMADLKLVTKNYPKPEEPSKLSFALAEPDLKIKIAVSNTATSGLVERIKYIGAKTGCFMTAESEKILLSKGFTITETFESYNAMTFTQKRNTSALFYPEIIIDMEEKSQREHLSAPFYSKDTIKGRLEVNAKVSIVMLEPLSGEKIWVKSIPVTGLDEIVEYKPELYIGTELNGIAVPEDLVPIATKIDAMFTKISEDVLEATNKYVEQHEFEFLNTDIVKLKGIKRY